MILITGTNIDVTQLPRYETMDYQIDNSNMNIKLKTVAKSTSCFQIFIAEDKRAEYTITDELSSKIKYFKDNGCEYVLVDVFAYNEMAIKFYEKSGYHARMLNMIKKI